MKLNNDHIIWITDDIEEWDIPDVEPMEYKDKMIKCYIRDVDVYDKNVENYQVGDYILEHSNMIYVNKARLWNIIHIYEPDEYHDGKNCRRMIISECWKSLKLESHCYHYLKNET